MTIGETGGAAQTECPNQRAVKDSEWALGMLTGKWKGEILWHLVQRTHRFGELRRAIPGVTQHMLTMQLRELEAHGLVKRTVFAEVPPRVEYELTESARALRPVFDELFRWSAAHRARTSPVEAARPVTGPPAT